jgi:hypothetical protein
MDPWKVEIAGEGSGTQFALNEFCPFVEDYCDCTGVEEICGGHAFNRRWLPR